MKGVKYMAERINSIVNEYERENAGMQVNQTAMFDNADFLYRLVVSYLGSDVYVNESMHDPMYQSRRAEGANPTQLWGKLEDVSAVERVMQYAYREVADKFREEGRDVQNIYQYPDQNAMYYIAVLDPLFGSEELKQIAKGEHPKQLELYNSPLAE